MKRKLWIFTIVCVVVLAPLLWLLGVRMSTDRDLAAIQKMGFPTTYEELDTSLTKPGTNAAPLYVDIIQRLRKKEKSYTDLRSRITRGSNEQFAAYADLQEEIALARKASMMEFCVANPIMRVGVVGRSSTPYLDALGIGDVLASAADVEARTGKHKEFCESIAATQRVIAHVKSMPGFVSYLNATAIQRYQTMAVATKLNIDRSKKSLGDVWNLVKDQPALPDFRWMIASEFPDTLYQMSDLPNPHAEYHEELDRSQLKWMLAQNRIAVRIGTSQLVRGYRRTLEKLSGDPLKWQADAQICLTEGETVENKWPSREYMMSSLYVYSETASGPMEMVAMQRVAATTAMILIYKSDHRRLPAKLPFINANTKDPFGGKQLLYKKISDTGFAVWSIGPDLKDDGAPAGTAGFSRSQDISITLD